MRKIFFFLAFSLIGMAAADAASPTGRWTPETLTIVAAPGQPETIAVNFQNLADLRDVSIRASDSRVAQIVAIAPATSTRLAKDAVTPVFITFTVPKSAAVPTRLDGEITVRAGAATVAAPLKFTLTVASAASVGGSDANGNGIRDDIDQYIAATFSDANQTAAARQFATALHAAVLHAGDKAAALANAARVTAAIDCMASFADQTAFDRILEIQPLELNDSARTQAWLAYNEQIAGGYFTGIVGNRLVEACDR